MGNRRLRVLVIAQYFPPDMGGGATRAYNIVKGLLLTGCDVTVVAAVPHYPRGEIPKKYRRKLIRIELKGRLRIIRTYVPPVASTGVTRRILLFTSFALSSLLSLPFVGKIDVIWAANPNVIAMFPSTVFKMVKHCPLVQNVDDLWPEALYDVHMRGMSFFLRIAGWLAKISYRLAEAITPISPAYVEVITNKYETAPSKIHVIPAGIDLDRFDLRELHKAGKSQREFTVLYIGSFSYAYNFDQLFEAAKLLDSYQDIRFVIQGGGELACELKSKAKNLKLGNIRVIDKIVSREEVARVLGEADALILPLNGAGSIELGVSSKLYEYQAARKPIICCSTGQPGRYVSETKSGIVIRPGDYEKLAKSIVYLKKNPNIAKKLGKSGRRYVEKAMRLEKIGARMREIMVEVQAARGRT